MNSMLNKFIGGDIFMLVGKIAPSFKTKAFINGEIKEVKLEDYRGKWVVLCFYPGDFTFV